jgi:hypothetical protein
MRSRYLLIIALLVYPVVTSVANAENRTISVGPHIVQFNASIPSFKQIEYSPMYDSVSGYYTYYETQLFTEDRKLFLWVKVRDFKQPIPGAQELEIETLTDFGSGFYKDRYHGVVVRWPSDQIEIVICGVLPSPQAWLDIANTVKLWR